MRKTALFLETALVMAILLLNSSSLNLVQAAHAPDYKARKPSQDSDVASLLNQLGLDLEYKVKEGDNKTYEITKLEIPDIYNPAKTVNEQEVGVPITDGTFENFTIKEGVEFTVEITGIDKDAYLVEARVTFEDENVTTMELESYIIPFVMPTADLVTMENNIGKMQLYADLMGLPLAIKTEGREVVALMVYEFNGSDEMGTVLADIVLEVRFDIKTGWLTYFSSVVDYTVEYSGQTTAGSAAVEIKEVGGGDNSTPGFEAIMLLTVLPVVVRLVYRKNEQE